MTTEAGGGAGPLPVPPPELIRRIGSDDAATFESEGRTIAADLLRLLPQGWAAGDRRLLDFGCGSGRALRALAERTDLDLWGCDIDGPSVRWLEEHLSPICRSFRCDPSPPLPVPSAYFDVVMAYSVFTHITTEWSRWLLELHRVLKQGGLLVATFLGGPMYEMIVGETPSEDEIGMNVLLEDQSWDVGGPMVIHSPWWIREHWGRLFDVERLDVAGFGPPGDPSTGQGVVVMRKDGRPQVGAADLEAIRRDEVREVAALRANISQLQRESITFRDSCAAYRAENERLRAQLRDAARNGAAPDAPPTPRPSFRRALDELARAACGGRPGTGTEA